MEKEILHIGSRRPRIAMVSTHGYVSAHPPLGAADTGGQVVYVLELSKKLALQGFEVDIWTRRFEDQPEVELVSERTRIIRAPSGGRQFIPKEYLFETLGEWGDNALTFIRDRRLSYRFVDSHYWDGGIAGGILSSAAVFCTFTRRTPWASGRCGRWRRISRETQRGSRRSTIFRRAFITRGEST